MKLQWLMFKHRWQERGSAVCRWLAWRAPRPLVEWCAIRMMAFATVQVWPEKTPHEVSVTDALCAWQLQGNQGIPTESVRG